MVSRDLTELTINEKGVTQQGERYILVFTSSFRCIIYYVIINNFKFFLALFEIFKAKRTMNDLNRGSSFVVQCVPDLNFLIEVGKNAYTVALLRHPHKLVELRLTLHGCPMHQMTQKKKKPQQLKPKEELFLGTAGQGCIDRKDVMVRISRSEVVDAKKKV